MRYKEALKILRKEEKVLWYCNSYLGEAVSTACKALEIVITEKEREKNGRKR